MTSIIQQLKTWDQLIDQRIKLEEILYNCNSLPQLDTWDQLHNIDKEKKLIKYQNLAEKQLSILLQEIFNLETCLEKLNPNLLNEDCSKNDEKNEDDISMSDSNYEDDINEKNNEEDQEEEKFEFTDEEDDYIEYLSDENDPESIKPNDNSILKENLNEKSIIDFDLNLEDEVDKIIQNSETHLKEKFSYLNELKNNILNYWYEKTRFTLKGGKLDKNSLDSFEQSTIKSIEHALLNRLKLIKKTQFKRGNYKIIGKLNEENEKLENKSELVEKRKTEIYDTEIFDDSDFYHQLLRELVNNLGPSSLNNSSKVNPKWLKLMKERFKSNKYVDTKNTKAKKIRYKVHNELINFMTPMTHLCKYDNAQHENLINSIFGKKNVNTKESTLKIDSSSDSE